MADYFTHFSCVLDVGTPTKATAALELLDRLRLEEEDADDPEFSGFTLSLQDGPGSSVLWFHDDGGQGDFGAGTPGGVGNKRTPPVFMKPGDVCEIEVDAIGVLRNGIRDE